MGVAVEILQRLSSLMLCMRNTLFLSMRQRSCQRLEGRLISNSSDAVAKQAE